MTNTQEQMKHVPPYRVLVICDEHEPCRKLLDSLRSHSLLALAESTIKEGLYHTRHWNYHVVIVKLKQLDVHDHTMLMELQTTNVSPVLLLNDAEFPPPNTELSMAPYSTSTNKLIPLLLDLIEAHQSPPELQARSVRINVSRREVFQEEELIPMSPTEFKMLKLFLQRKGEIINRETIYKEIFSDSGSHVSTLLDVYIHKLRDKLGSEFIKTHRGIGYTVAV